MENLDLTKLFNSIYKGKKVFITGHTGFKGTWLTVWLNRLGAEVIGYSKDISTEPNHFSLLSNEIIDIKGNINDYKSLSEAINKYQPEIIFHLAAQSLVRYSYSNPQETFNTNVMGTVNIFEAAKQCDSVKVVINITSDKAYENLEMDIAYKETDRMGGYDPYSASKGCAELIVNSYRNSFFNKQQYKIKHHILLASVRAGNVIGGGDWAEDRLVPDIIRASIEGRPAIIRNPKASRPWQHVLEPLSGYLLLGQLLLNENVLFADGWNFGPAHNLTLTVDEVLVKMLKIWPELQFKIQSDSKNLHEATLLRLDCAKSINELSWNSVWDMDNAIKKTTTWYKDFYMNNKINTHQDLYSYIHDAKSKNINWTK